MFSQEFPDHPYHQLIFGSRLGWFAPRRSVQYIILVQMSILCCTYIHWNEMLVKRLQTWCMATLIVQSSFNWADSGQSSKTVLPVSLHPNMNYVRVTQFSTWILLCCASKNYSRMKKKMSQSDHTSNFHDYVIISVHIFLYFVSVAQFFAKLILSVARFLYRKVFKAWA